MSQRKRYHVYGIAFDSEGLTEGDFQDFRRHLDKLEGFEGVHLLGVSWTDSWPDFTVRETPRPTKAVEP